MPCLIEQFNILSPKALVVFFNKEWWWGPPCCYSRTSQCPKTILVDPLESGLDSLAHEGLKVPNVWKGLFWGKLRLYYSVVNHINVCSFLFVHFYPFSFLSWIPCWDNTLKTSEYFCSKEALIMNIGPIINKAQFKIDVM